MTQPRDSKGRFTKDALSDFASQMAHGYSGMEYRDGTNWLRADDNAIVT